MTAQRKASLQQMAIGKLRANGITIYNNASLGKICAAIATLTGRPRIAGEPEKMRIEMKIFVDGGLSAGVSARREFKPLRADYYLHVRRQIEERRLS